MLCLILAVILPLLVICSGCEEVERRFSDSNIYERCDWYRYPAKVQRALPIIIIGSQNLNPFKMYGNVTASRETCKKVLNDIPKYIVIKTDLNILR